MTNGPRATLPMSSRFLHIYDGTSTAVIRGNPDVVRQLAADAGFTVQWSNLDRGFLCAAGRINDFCAAAEFQDLVVRLHPWKARDRDDRPTR